MGQTLLTANNPRPSSAIDESYPGYSQMKANAAQLNAMTNDLYYAAMASNCPPQAAAVGYNQLTFGPDLTLNQNWYPFNLLNVTPVSGQAVQNADGSMYLPGNSGDAYSATICSASYTGGTQSWKGKIFGGGAYVEAVFKFTPTVGSNVFGPAFWAEDIGFLTGNPLQWPGQATNFIHRVEWDIVQWPENSGLYYEGTDTIDWFGETSSGAHLSGVAITGTAGQFSCSTATPTTLTVGDYMNIVGTLTGSGSVTGYTGDNWYKISAVTGNPATAFTLTTTSGSAITTTAGTTTGLSFWNGVNGQPSPVQGGEIKISQSNTIPPLLLSNYNKFGCLWIPATSTTQGSLTNYLNGVPVIYAAGASNVSWNQYSAANAPPPVRGTTAASILDVSSIAFIFGTNTDCPMTIKSMCVWQSSDANNSQR